MSGLLISIVIPTFRRPEGLAALLGDLTGDLAGDVEVLVVDNSPEAGAAGLVAGFAGVTCLHEPRPGVAHARNAGVARARGRFVLFIDDDERPGPGWLAGWRQVAETGVAAAFGPVEPVFETPPPLGLQGAFEAMFSRRMALPDGADITDRRAWLGTGNSMFDRARCFPDGPPFEARFNGGGEDVWLLRSLVEVRGLRLTWSARTPVCEHVPAARLTPAYLRARRFHGGRLRVVVEAGGGHGGRVLFWMAAGLVQALGHGAAALALWPTSRRDAQLAKAAGGLGKLLWWRHP